MSYSISSFAIYNIGCVCALLRYLQRGCTENVFLCESRVVMKETVNKSARVQVAEFLIVEFLPIGNQ